MVQLVEVPQDEWIDSYSRSEAAHFSGGYYYYSNPFGSMQWMGKENIKRAPQYWCLIKNGKKISWTQTYHLSSQVVRFRGLVTESQFRNQGYARQLLNNVIQRFTGPRKFVVFSIPTAQEFYIKCGFHHVKDFQPRPIEIFDPAEEKYKRASDEVLYLMERVSIIDWK